MAARIPYIMPRFDRDTPHVVLRPFELDGRMLAPGSAFDRSRVTVRLHRLLYEQRKVGPSQYLDGSGAAASNEGRKINIAPVRHLEARPAKFGKWAVFEGDVKVSKLMTEDQARQSALTMAQCPA